MYTVYSVHLVRIRIPREGERNEKCLFDVAGLEGSGLFFCCAVGYASPIKSSLSVQVEWCSGPCTCVFLRRRRTMQTWTPISCCCRRGNTYLHEVRVCSRLLARSNYTKLTIFFDLHCFRSTYDHRLKRTGYPVRSGILKS